MTKEYFEKHISFKRKEAMIRDAFNYVAFGTLLENFNNAGKSTPRALIKNLILFENIELIEVLLHIDRYVGSSRNIIQSNGTYGELYSSNLVASSVVFDHINESFTEHRENLPVSDIKYNFKYMNDNCILYIEYTYYKLDTILNIIIPRLMVKKIVLSNIPNKIIKEDKRRKL